ncbi:Teichoic acids export ATP-binding protein TagH [Candidatus Arcanobacter lacustris]|uniref:Teichoic acids export ATP-binding protein TagH n=1 Tax=Candidatus Arcanibacter lacustris TaxID=1607817 RepID=A0A0F5MNP2_9RICK|nr:Teichoic acids export ATP-binding protein TagH [Candidatus Arcanobacter lacustris]
MTKDVFIKLQDVYVESVDVTKRASSIRNLIFAKESLKSTFLPILNNINFSAKPGDRIGIIGRNGCGKSSLLKTIAGIYPAKSGSVSLQGSLVPLIEMGVGFDSELSGRHNIQLALCYSGRMDQYSKELEEQIIDFAELAEKIDMPLKNFSSGMVTRLAFSCSIFNDPDILLLDEVFATGDASFVKKSQDFMLKKLENTAITIIVNHSIDAIKSICNRCVLMDNGYIIADGSVDEVTKQYI